ncbi:MAG TPA: hypothetical protein VGN12_26360 [Pirellulales bacterium]|jgi:hypothetical protein
MRDFVRQFLTSASTTLELGGPVALLAGERASGEAADWLRRQFAGELVLNCQVPTLPNARRELDLGNLPVECDSLQTLLCLDLLTRFEETAELLQISLPLLAPGGMVLITADIGNERPQAGLSRVLTPVGLERLVADLDAAILGWQGDPDFPSSLFLVACRSPVAPRFAHSAGRFIEAFQWNQRLARARPPWIERILRWLQQWSAFRFAAPADGAADTTSFLLHLPSAANWKDALLNWPPAKDATSQGLDLC